MVIGFFILYGIETVLRHLLWQVRVTWGSSAWPRGNLMQEVWEAQPRDNLAAALWNVVTDHGSFCFIAIVADFPDLVATKLGVSIIQYKNSSLALCWD